MICCFLMGLAIFLNDVMACHIEYWQKKLDRENEQKFF